jgi:hypothetical protein
MEAPLDISGGQFGSDQVTQMKITDELRKGRLLGTDVPLGTLAELSRTTG